MRDLSKTWVLTGKQFKDFRRKKQKQNSQAFKNIRCNTRPQNKRFSGNYCASYNITSVTPKRMLKAQTFEKVQTSSEKNS